MTIKGYLETIEPRQICGWAYDPDQPDRHIEVEVLCGDQPLGRVKADIYRRDLEEASIGSGDHAFVFNTELVLNDSDNLLVSARVTGADQALTVLARLAQLTVAPDLSLPRASVTFPLMTRDEEHRPLFILGGARSGTSAIVSGILAATRYRGQEEGHFLDVLAPLLVHLHEFYSSKSDERSERNTMISYIPETYLRNALSHAVILATRQIYPDGLWIDKTPNSNMIHLAPQLLKIWPNARFLFMKRRALENLVSRRQKFGYDFRRNCEEWSAAMRAWLQVRDGLKDVGLELDQHFLMLNPKEAAKKISILANFSEIESQRLITILANIRSQRTMSVFGKTLSLAEVNWTEEELCLYDEICRPMMHEFSYSEDSSYYRRVVF